MLSDHMREVSRLYGVLNEKNGFASRVTFVIDMDGKILGITENQEAIDVTGALTACSRSKKH